MCIRSLNSEFLYVVEQPEIYRGADLTYPHQKKYRYKAVPRDSLHIACMLIIPVSEKDQNKPSLLPFQNMNFYMTYTPMF